MLVKTTKLQEAQQPLERGDLSNVQAVIPMTDGNAGDVNTLQKDWGDGSMYWNDTDDLVKMRGICNGERPICAGEGYEIAICGFLQTATNANIIPPRLCIKGSSF